MAAWPSKEQNTIQIAGTKADATRSQPQAKAAGASKYPAGSGMYERAHCGLRPDLRLSHWLHDSGQGRSCGNHATDIPVSRAAT